MPHAGVVYALLGRRAQTFCLRRVFRTQAVTKLAILICPAAPRRRTPAVIALAARLTPIEGRELRALCMRENDELLVLHRAYEESVQDGIFGGSEWACWQAAGRLDQSCTIHMS